MRSSRNLPASNSLLRRNCKRMTEYEDDDDSSMLKFARAIQITTTIMISDSYDNRIISRCFCCCFRLGFNFATSGDYGIVDCRLNAKQRSQSEFKHHRLLVIKPTKMRFSNLQPKTPSPCTKICNLLSLLLVYFVDVM